MGLIDNKKIFCCYCGRWIVYPLKRTAEHLVPLSKGGNNTVANKRDCCQRCNTWRGNKSFVSFKNEVLHYLENHFSRWGYSKLDLETMIENIDYWKHYVDTSNGRLLKGMAGLIKKHIKGDY